MTPERGFALIAAITLMLLLALISVGIMTLATTVSRNSNRGRLAEEARAQARLALQIALGRMQAELGPDQRITALSGIASSQSDKESTQGVSSPYVMGVWDSWDTWLNRTSKKNGRIQDTYTKGRETMFRRWLISAADEELLRRWGSVSGGGSRGLGTSTGRDKSKILLLGKGTLGDNQESKSIYGGLVEVDSAAAGAPLRMRSNYGNPNKPLGNKNFIAWWVTGENLKARVNLPKNKSEDKNTIDILAHMWDTPTPDSTMIPGLESFNFSVGQPYSTQYDDKMRTIFTRGILNIVNTSGSRKNAMPYYHDASLESSGLITDVRFGGLKKDLSILLSQDSLANTDFYESNGADVGIRPYSSEDAAGKLSVDRRPISSWKQMYYWYSLWDPKVKTGQATTAPMYWDGKGFTSSIAADTAEKNNVVMNNRYTYQRQPVLLRMYIFVGFMLSARTVNIGGDQTWNPTGYQGGRPVYVWWNPYNVTLEAGSKTPPLAGFSYPYRIQPVQARFIGPNPDGLLNNAWTEVGYAFGNYNPQYPGSRRGIRDAGNPFFDTLNDKKFTLKPGEIKVYSHDLTRKKKDQDPYIARSDSDADLYQHYNVGDNMIYVGGLGSELTMMKSRYNVPDIPTMTSYGGGLVDIADRLTPWRLSQLRMGLRFASTQKTLFNPEFGEMSLYNLFMKPSSDSDSKFSFTAGVGLLADNASALSNQELDQGKAIGQYFPSFFSMNWLQERPIELTIDGDFEFTEAVFNLMWNGYKGRAEGKDDDGASTRENLGMPNPLNNPLWFSYYGISAKSAYPPVDPNSRQPDPDKFPDQADLRVKSWVHSSPFFWGSAMENPSDILRKNHPYQLEVRRRRSGDYSQINLEEVIGHIPNDKDNKAYFGPVGEDQVNRIVSQELPVHPPFSLAGFANFRLTPGWYEESSVLFNGSGEAKRAKRFAYQSGVPGVGIGNAFADPMIVADKIHYNLSEQEADLADYWDHGLMVNDALWDSWFTSSISNRPTSLGGNAIGYKEVTNSFVEGALGTRPDPEKSLPNSRFTLLKSPATQSTITQEINGDKGWEKSAKHLKIDGAFNVNSTSRAAWMAVLNALKERKVLYNETDNLTPKVNPDSGGGDILLTRFSIGNGATSRYDQPLLKIQEANNVITWSDYRKLTGSRTANDNSDIARLADEIIKQVKTRGPFLNMSDFINRRLNSGDEGNTGALQTAIDNAGFNDNFKQTNIIPEYKGYNNSKASEGSPQVGSPGYIIQSDILAALGNTLTVRDDTFTVRAYGQVCDPSGKKIESRAWCEAVVQRSIDYVDPSNTPETPAFRVNTANGELEDSGLSAINKAFGRQLKVVSFRWLSPEEV